MTEITQEIAKRVLEVVDAGLVKGVGWPELGKMCVEAAVCYAMGEPHGDEPSCVAPALRALKIKLNDAQWSTTVARAKGLRRLALAQLGSRGALDDKEFVTRCATLAIQTCVPTALRAAASKQTDEAKKKHLLDCAEACEKEPTRENAIKARNAAYAAAAYSAADAAADAYAADAYAYAAYAYAAYAAADAYAADAYAAYSAADAAAAYVRDSILSTFAEGVVQILIAMNAPGCQWLGLTE